ncbi:single-stranded DNA-binding protein [Nocardioides sp. TF02-7]|uniref:single-stranded DNA-binding protein n=1 Tax=Nocardioides sp. TF02-7 TaxID=2917724 RepID=UPI001F05DB56|nr:single-stranded DNA-binding protein [Nocardioides sp. TF02-7]UMG92590.1 single-stranded DNA-binding protein [Nocardioides sp. TF02-7]
MSTRNEKSRGPSTGSRNEVHLVGAVSGTPETRELPSGDLVCVARVVVPRTPVRVRGDGRRSPSVDVIDCCAWDARPRRSLGGWQPGDEVEVTGALRRRFFRTGGATASRVEVEVSSARVVRRATAG